MKTQLAKDKLVEKANRITTFIEGVCSGLFLAYVISAFSHPMPDAVLYSAFGVMLIAAWLPVIARRIRVQEASA